MSRPQTAGAHGRPAVEVLARFSALRSTPAPVTCDECGDTVTASVACPTCRQAAGSASVGILAVAHTTAAGDRRIVLAERTAAGGWAPLRSFAADARAERMLRRQRAHVAGTLDDARPELFEVAR